MLPLNKGSDLFIIFILSFCLNILTFICNETTKSRRVVYQPRAVVCWRLLLQLLGTNHLHLFPSPCSVVSHGELKLPMIGAFTPRKLANGIITVPSFPSKKSFTTMPLIQGLYNLPKCIAQDLLTKYLWSNNFSNLQRFLKFPSDGKISIWHLYWYIKSSDTNPK